MTREKIFDVTLDHMFELIGLGDGQDGVVIDDTRRQLDIDRNKFLFRIERPDGGMRLVIDDATAQYDITELLRLDLRYMSWHSIMNAIVDVMDNYVND